MIIKFYSTTCGPCKILEKQLKDNNLIVDKSININDDTNNFVIKYNITNVPTLLKLNDGGVEVDRITNLVDLKVLKKFFIK